LAAEVKKQGKRCILLWMAGGASQLDTFDMKMGRKVSGPFRPISTSVTGVQICEHLPNIAKQADRLAIIRSMQTKDPGHSTGTYAMHTSYPPEANLKHPEIGAVVAKYLGDPASQLPSFIQIQRNGGGESTPFGGSGFLGAAYQPFRLGQGGNLPENSTPYLPDDANNRRIDLLKKLEEGMAEHSKADSLQAHRAAQEKARRLLNARSAFDISSEWSKYSDLYGDTGFGKDCLAARRLIEAGVPFVEVEQQNYDSHADNFDWHKALLPVCDRAWAGLMIDLHDRGLLQDTLIVWMGEVGRTPSINNRAGRDHFVRAWSIVLAGGGVKGGQVYGETDADAKEVKDKPVSEGDLFATIYTALGINPRIKHMAGTRPVRITPDDAEPIKELLA
jgi:hypothetical protein